MIQKITRIDFHNVDTNLIDLISFYVRYSINIGLEKKTKIKYSRTTHVQELNKELFKNIQFAKLSTQKLLLINLFFLIKNELFLQSQNKFH